MSVIINGARPQEGFIAHEYKTIVASRKLSSVYLDCYPSFGWTLDDSYFSNYSDRVSMTFKRDRQLKNKPEVNKLQRQFEQGVENIAHLENTKRTRAQIIAITVGLIGTAFMAGATFSFLGGFIIACILLAIPGFVGWGLAYFLFRKFCKKREDEIVPLIDQEFDSLYSSCEKARAVLA